MNDDDRDLVQTVEADLAYLATSWSQRQIDDNFLRRDSNVLRRLVVNDGQGDIRRFLRLKGEPAEPTVECIDLEAQIDGLDRSLIVFASAGGASHLGTQLAGGLQYAAAMSEALVKQRHKRGLQTKTLGLSAYLDAPCLIVGGATVNRRAVIQYIANRKGGVHFDETRDGSKTRSRPELEEKFKALDLLARSSTSFANKQAVYFELLSIGQQLLASPQIAPFVPAASPLVGRRPPDA